jgi:hypothetical protein
MEESEIINKYREYDFFLPKDTIFNMIVFLKLIIDFLNNNNIEYVAYGGTLLGVVRNNGLIPWDDDIDLFICEKDEYKLFKLEEEAIKYGLRLMYKPIDKDGNKRKTFMVYDLYKKSSIFCDIFIMKKIDKYIEYSDKYYLENFPGREIYLNELYPIQKKNIYGCIDVNILNDYDKYFNRCNFGEYKKIAKIYPKHLNRTEYYEFDDENLAIFNYNFLPENIIKKCGEIMNEIKKDMENFDADYYRKVNCDPKIKYTNIQLMQHYIYDGKYENLKKCQ